MRPTPVTTRLYVKGVVVEQDFGVDRVAELMRTHPDAVLWLDMLDPEQADLQTVRRLFDLHPLAVEDAVEDHQRPKVDRYPNHLFMNVYAVSVDVTRPEPALHKTEISSFVTGRALITVHKSEGDLDRLIERWDADDGLAADGGIGFLVYGLLDLVVDGHLGAARRVDEAMDGAEDDMLEEGGAPRAVRMYGFALRKLLATLRRTVSPMPELMAQLERDEQDLIHADLRPYFRDIDDHTRRATETIESSWDRINGLLDADLNEQSNALNVTTRKLAAWAAIIAVPTALTGYFGQNVPYPGYEKWWGFLVSSAAIVVSGGALYWYLKRRGWL